MEVETFSQKFWRKCSAEPFVPLGLVTTSLMLAGGLNAFRKRNARESQLFMRARCLAQAFTIGAFGVGFMMKFGGEGFSGNVDERSSDALFEKLAANVLKPQVDLDSKYVEAVEAEKVTAKELKAKVDAVVKSELSK